MLIDATHFPLVWMQINSEDGESDSAPFADFEKLLSRQQPLVLLNEEGLNNGQHEHSVEAMKYTTRWMKANKDALQAYVKAAIYIEPDASKREATASFSRMYEKFWGYPMLMVATKEQALTVAHQLLENNAESILSL